MHRNHDVPPSSTTKHDHRVRFGSGLGVVRSIRSSVFRLEGASGVVANARAAGRVGVGWARVREGAVGGCTRAGGGGAGAGADAGADAAIGARAAL
jgi:hypothetical protein